MTNTFEILINYMIKKFLQLFAVFLLLVNAIGAIYGGLSLVTDPTGERLQLSSQWLEHTPFNNFFIPGLVLLIVNGVLSIVVILFIIKKSKNYPVFISVEGSLLMAWIIIELFITLKYDPLQLMMGVAGLLLILCGWKLNHPFKRDGSPFNIY
jgi:hypothetical protein